MSWSQQGWQPNIETQSNDALLTVMLHAFARDVASKSILFTTRSPKNLASRKTLQKAGFVPFGHILAGSIPS